MGEPERVIPVKWEDGTVVGYAVQDRNPPPPETPPNRADSEWERLLRLRVEAVELGIEVDDAWPIQRLVEEIAAKS